MRLTCPGYRLSWRTVASNCFTLPTLLMAFGLGGLFAVAQISVSGLPANSPAAGGSNALAEADQPAAAAAVLKEVRPGVFELGVVRINKAQRTVSFPAVLNLTRGAMEYFLVTPWGKTHESILRTDAEPRLIHAAMLLIGAKGAEGQLETAQKADGGATADEGQFVSQPSAFRLRGDQITLTVGWESNGKGIRKAAEALVLNRAKGAPLPKGCWIYNGSRLADGVFLADADGSVVSLVTDSAALINSVAPGHEDDAIWIANTNALPPADIPLEITIQISSAALGGDSPGERTFRLLLLAGFVLFAPIGIYHRIRARTGEKLDRRQEGWFILIGLRLVATIAMAGLITWLISPRSLAWAAMPLPVWLRWTGAGIGALSGAAFTWTFRSLGRNITDTVVTRKEHTLVTTGPYRWVRHPFYSSAALAILANSLLTANGFIFVTGGLILVLLVIRTRKEEENLLARFGDPYRDHIRRTGRFVPRW